MPFASLPMFAGLAGRELEQKLRDDLRPLLEAYMALNDPVCVKGGPMSQKFKQAYLVTNDPQADRLVTALSGWEGGLRS